jgi:ribosomal protein S27E
MAYPDAVGEQSNRGNSLETECRYCGNELRGETRETRGEHFQVIVACAECGNTFAALSGN